MILNVLQRKTPKARRQWVLSVVVRDAQRALKPYAANRILMHLGKLKN